MPAPISSTLKLIPLHKCAGCSSWTIVQRKQRSMEARLLATSVLALVWSLGPVRGQRPILRLRLPPTAWTISAFGWLSSNINWLKFLKLFNFFYLFISSCFPMSSFLPSSFGPSLWTNSSGLDDLGWVDIRHLSSSRNELSTTQALWLSYHWLINWFICLICQCFKLI